MKTLFSIHNKLVFCEQDVEKESNLLRVSPFLVKGVGTSIRWTLNFLSATFFIFPGHIRKLGSTSKVEVMFLWLECSVYEHLHNKIHTQITDGEEHYPHMLKTDTVPWWSHFSYFCLQMSTSYLTSGVIQMVKCLKTGTNLSAECASSIRYKCPFFQVELSSHKVLMSSSKGLNKKLPSPDTCWGDTIYQKNNKYCQYAGFERVFFPLTLFWAESGLLILLVIKRIA